MSQRIIQAGVTQPVNALLVGEQRVAVQELLRSLETRINIYIEEWWNKVLDNDEGGAEECRILSAIAPAVDCSHCRE
ncbi:MAG: hypothetical protein JOZ19_02150 [Rubrobacter sp.]|nr:hypothetical protein [Rubrobacter sp.]